MPWVRYFLDCASGSHFFNASGSIFSRACFWKSLIFSQDEEETTRDYFYAGLRFLPGFFFIIIICTVACKGQGFAIKLVDGWERAGRKKAPISLHGLPLELIKSTSCGSVGKSSPSCSELTALKNKGTLIQREFLEPGHVSAAFWGS